MRNCLVTVSIVLSMGFIASRGAETYGLDLHSVIDPLVKPLIDEDQLVGCVVGIVRGGEAQVLAYGETEKGSKKAPDGKTIYEIGSTTKAFTGVLLADAVNAGVVKLDETLQECVPKSLKVPVKDGKPITLEHLATHTSGLPRLPGNMRPKDPLNPYADYTPKQMAEFLSAHKLQRAPGEYEYSNYGMGLLGHVLGNKQGTTYEKLLIDRIAKPLKMEDTCVTLNEEQQNRLAPPYNASLSPDKNWDLPTLAGAGAIRSTADDMLNFVQAALGDDKEPVTKAIQLAFKKRHTMKDGLAIGLGWHIARDGITRWHNGMTGGYSSWVSVVPELNAGVVVLSNTATGKTTELGGMLTRVACGIKVAPPKERMEVKVDPKVLEAYTGVFAITPQFALTVTEEDGKLMVQATGQSKHALFPESTTKFFLRVVDAQITFVPNQDGKVDELILHQNGIDQKATRQK